MDRVLTRDADGVWLLLHQMTYFEPRVLAPTERSQLQYYWYLEPDLVQIPRGPHPNRHISMQQPNQICYSYRYGVRTTQEGL